MTAPREQISLDGDWQFAIDDAQIGLEEHWYENESVFDQSIQVPGCWQAQAIYCHTGWYRTSVVVPENWRDNLIWLKFGGVSYETDVWVNGQPAMCHEGLMLPFEAEISDYLHPGVANDIVVRVAQFDYPNVFQTEQLGDKLLGVYGCWMTWGGIYQSVVLETTRRTWVDHVFLVPDIDQPSVTARIRLKQVVRQSRSLTIVVNISPQQGEVVFQQSASVVLEGSEGALIDVTVPIQDAVLWHPDQPFLYHAQVSVSENNQLIDQISERFGMRHIEVRGNQIRLNHEPIFLRGWLDDAIFPDLISPTITKQDARKLLETCKAYGFNFVRHHTHIAVPIYHQVADELGILQLEEFASFGSIGNPRVDPTQKTRQQIFQTWQGMIERDCNHPSIIAYGINNECWNDYEFLSWAPVYRDLYDLGKQLDPTRLIIDNSGGEDHWSVASDVYDKHLYQFPTEKEMQRSTEDRKYRGYIPKREAYFNVDLSLVGKPCLVTEVGGWCTFPDFEKIRVYTGGKTPWWLSRDPLVNPRMAHALVNRMEAGMAEAGLADLYPRIVANSEHYADMANKLQLEHLRQTPGIAGYAYCTFTDCYNWGAGIVDNYLQPKSYAQSFARLNQASVLLWLRSRWCFRAREAVEITLAVSHYDNQPITNGELHWKLKIGDEVLAEDTENDISLASYQIHDFPPFRLIMPELPNAARLTLEITLADQHHLIENSWSLWVFPPPDLDTGPQIVLFEGTEDAFGRWKPVFPYIHRCIDETYNGQILITTHLTENAIRFLESGGKVLWLQNGSELSCRPYTQQPAVDYHATIVSEHPITAVFPNEGWCDLQFHHLIGAAVLDTGYFDPSKLTPIIEAFHVPYWMQNPRILPFRRKGFLAEAQVGRGRLLITSFVFEGLQRHPEVDALAGVLIAYLLNPQIKCASTLSADEVREWAWGSVKGEAVTDYVPYLM